MAGRTAILYLLPFSLSEVQIYGDIDFHANIRKRLVKTPKIYFYDVGLAACLCGVETAAHIRSHPLRGHFFENMMIAEILKFRFNMGRRNNLTFFRDNTGNEVDVLYHVADEIIPIEIKAGQTITSELFMQEKWSKSGGVAMF